MSVLVFPVLIYPPYENIHKSNCMIDSSSATNSTATATAAPSATTSGSGTSVPSPVQTGITSGCNEYYLVKKDDSCYNIEQDRNITKADFNKWNPAVGSDCADLLTGFYVCVGV